MGYWTQRDNSLTIGFMDHYRRTSHTRFDIKLHFVWITKYRKPFLTGTIASGNVTDEVVREYIDKQDILKPDDNFKVDHGL